ncbi:hypothetical protein KIL84_019638 [Mauremys mutica]|uniref:Uncharacterized protein n=1 Tax=Mauremys mutica TaxID=74926 RepID=A0A9D3XU72_9SAUR|nr:hypothetical protein KIL84_019638 [Mauremys mutica]
MARKEQTHDHVVTPTPIQYINLDAVQYPSGIGRSLLLYNNLRMRHYVESTVLNTKTIPCANAKGNSTFWQAPLIALCLPDFTCGHLEAQRSTNLHIKGKNRRTLQFHFLHEDHITFFSSFTKRSLLWSNGQSNANK